MNSFINRTVLQLTAAQFRLIADNLAPSGFARQSRITFEDASHLHDFERNVLKGLDLRTTRAYVSYQSITKKLDEIRLEFGRIEYAQREREQMFLHRRAS